MYRFALISSHNSLHLYIVLKHKHLSSYDIHYIQTIYPHHCMNRLYVCVKNRIKSLKFIAKNKSHRYTIPYSIPLNAHSHYIAKNQRWKKEHHQSMLQPRISIYCATLTMQQRRGFGLHTLA